MQPQLPPHTRRVRFLLVLLLAWLVIALGVAGPVRRVVARSQQSGDSSGYLIVAGTYIPPPYSVAASGEQVLLDGVVFEDFSYQPAPLTQKPIDETDPTLSAEDLGELARRYVVANYPAGSGEVATEAAALYLRGLPATASVDDSTPALLAITDQQGSQMTALLEDPSLLTPPAEDGSAAATSEAADLQQQLATDVVFMRTDGGLTTLPRADGVAVLQLAAQLVQQGASSDAIAQQIAPLLPSPELASELGQSFTPDAALLARLMNEPAGAAPPSSSTSPTGGSTSAPQARYLDFNPDHHPTADTPGSPKATIFLTTAATAGETTAYDVKTSLENHHYTVTVANADQNTRWVERPRGTPVSATDPGGLLQIVRSDTKDFTGSATPADFLSITGVLYMNTHGAPGWLTLKRYGTADEAARDMQVALSGLTITGVGGTPTTLPPLAQQGEVAVTESDGFFFLAFSKAWIAKQWVDDDTVVFMNVCYSDSLYDGGFGAAGHADDIVAPVDGPGPREYVGYTEPVIHRQLVPDAQSPSGVRVDRYGPRDEVQFAQEMAGMLDAGDNRAARLAFSTLKQDHPVPTGPDGKPLQLPLPDPDHPGQNKIVRAEAAKSVLHRRPNIQFDTVLSPAVDLVSPTLDPVQTFQAGSMTYSGYVNYDTWLTTKPSAMAEIKLTGCLKLLTAQWTVTNGFTTQLRFTFQATAAGSATLTATWPNALSRNNTRELSGNTPPGDHQERNRKDFVWKATCTAPATTGTGGGTGSSTGTGGGTGTGSGTGTGTSTAPPGGTPKKVSLVPSSGAPGTAVALSAGGFTPGATGTVTFGSTQVATATVQQDGSATAQFSVPMSAPSGGAVVSFATPQDGTASATFLVMPGSIQPNIPPDFWRP